MEEARSSWNTAYLTAEGFECQITLRDENELALAERVDVIIAGITEAGGTPLRRRAFNSDNSSAPASDIDYQEKTYVDSKGVRRCNLRLNNGKRCNTAVVEKEGKYGLFWSCSNYKEHAAAS